MLALLNLILTNMKDFAQEFLSNSQDDEFRDPLLYLTKEVQEEVLQVQGIAVTSISLCNLAGLILTAPFQTISSSLQLSVKPHKTIHQEPASKTTQLAKLNTSLTIQQKRRMELMLRAGGQQKPYVAPVYDGYLGAIKGLMNQGYKAFFKGLFFRSIHQLAHFYSFTQIAILSGNHTFDNEKIHLSFQLLKIYGLQCLADITFNMFHIAQNRYILQNLIPQFRVFRNGSRVIKKIIIRKQALTGAKYHFLNNFVSVFFKMPFMFALASQQVKEQLAAIYYCSELFMYPFNTAFRRLVCQHSEIPGMIPVRYKSVSHAVRLIFSEEGILGLYKGFGMHHISLGLKLGLIFASRPVIEKYGNYVLN